MNWNCKRMRAANLIHACIVGFICDGGGSGGGGVLSNVHHILLLDQT